MEAYEVPKAHTCTSFCGSCYKSASLTTCPCSLVFSPRLTGHGGTRLYKHTLCHLLQPSCNSMMRTSACSRESLLLLVFLWVSHLQKKRQLLSLGQGGLQQ